MRRGKIRIPSVFLFLALAGPLGGCGVEPPLLARPAAAAPRTPEPTPALAERKVSELSPDTAQLVHALLALEPAEPDMKWWATPEFEAGAEFDAKLDELGNQAKAEQFTERASRISPEDRQKALARLAESSHQPLVALARAVEFEHTTSPEARKVLERLATDRTADPLARNLAIEGLIKPEWEGREELYVRLMADPTLQELRSDPDAPHGVEDEEVSLDELYSGENRSGYQLYQPLVTPVWETPDRWIPLVASLVGHSDVAKRFLKALLACGHFPRASQVEALTAFSKVADEWLRVPEVGVGGTKTSYRALLGEVLVEDHLYSEEVVKACIQLLDTMQEPTKKHRLERVVLAMETSATDEYVLRELASGRPSDQLVNSALTRREDLAKTQAPLLENMSAGAAKGLAASILKTGGVLVLRGTDVEAQAVLLACARLTADTLPVDLVEPLMATTAERAARAYLEALDTEGAEVVLKRHTKGPPLILGHSGGTLKTVAPSWEKHMREILKDDPSLTDVYALFTTGYYEGYGQFVLLVGKSKAEMRWYGGDETYQLRTLSLIEREEFLDFIEREKIDSLKKLNELAGHNAEYQYVHLNREGGRRVYFYSPLRRGEKARPYMALADRFKALLDEKAETKSRLVESVPGSKILFQATGQKQVGEIRGTREGEIYLKLAGPAISESFDQSQSGSRLQKSAEGPWRRIVDDRIVAVARTPWKDEKLPSHLDSPEELCTTIRGVARVGERGLYLYDAKGKKALLAAGTFANPVASSDGRWLACARSAGFGWSEPNEVVLIEVGSGRVISTTLPPEKILEPIGYLKSLNAFLVFRKKDNAKEGEAYLVFHDGNSRRIEGEFRLYFDVQRRPLQARGEEFWAALPSKDGGTDLGLYDAEKLSFRFWMKLPEVSVGSESVWVDEKGGRVYLISEGSLITVPLGPKPASWL